MPTYLKEIPLGDLRTYGEKVHYLKRPSHTDVLSMTLEQIDARLAALNLSPCFFKHEHSMGGARHCAARATNAGCGHQTLTFRSEANASLAVQQAAVAGVYLGVTTYDEEDADTDRLHHIAYALGLSDSTAQQLYQPLLGSDGELKDVMTDDERRELRQARCSLHVLQQEPGNAVLAMRDRYRALFRPFLEEKPENIRIRGWRSTAFQVQRKALAVHEAAVRIWNTPILGRSKF